MLKFSWAWYRNIINSTLRLCLRLEICLLQVVFETHFRLQIITKIMSYVLLRNRSYMDIFFKKNRFLGFSSEFLKFVSGIYFLLINTSLIEKASHPHMVFSSPYQCNFDHSSDHSSEEKHEKTLTFYKSSNQCVICHVG